MSKIIVALDGMELNEALKMARLLAGEVWGYKVNDQLVQSGKLVVETLRNHGRVFADPKFYDIPNTVANGVAALAGAGADLITVHASGQPEMLKAAVDVASQFEDTKILAVTVLTSYAEHDVVDTYNCALKGLVRKLATKAMDCGVWGVVASSAELELLRDLPFKKVIPAFRPPELAVQNDDQVRKGSYQQFLEADLVVVGRPITQAADPLEAARVINDGFRKAREASQPA
jgi:orotidine-5'-phosphate decarboxylase